MSRASNAAAAAGPSTPRTPAASSSSKAKPLSTPSSSKSAGAHKFTEEANRLYKVCYENAAKTGKKPCQRIWDTVELHELCQSVTPPVLPDVVHLGDVCQRLLDKKLFRPVTLGKQTCFRLREEDVAAKLRTLKNQLDMDVYELIEASENNGKWMRTIKSDLNVAQKRAEDSISRLESAKLIKTLKSIKAIGRRLYMLVGLTPLDDVAGGAFYSDGELDHDFIAAVSNVCVAFVERQSWRHSDDCKVPRDLRVPSTELKQSGKPGPKSQHRVGRSPLKRRRSSVSNSPHTNPVLPSATLPSPLGSATAPKEDDIENPRYLPVTDTAGARYILPHFAEYTGYPTASSVLTYLDGTGLIKGKDLTRHDMGMMLEFLCFDGRLERMGSKKVVIDAETGHDATTSVERDEDLPSLPQPAVISSSESSSSGSDSEEEEEDDEDEGPSRKRRKPGTQSTTTTATTATKQKDKPATHAASASTSPQLTAHPHPQALQPREGSRVVEETMYRSTYRQTLGASEGRSGLSETPCGVCPVFDECEGSSVSKINAEACRYLPKWLRLDLTRAEDLIGDTAAAAAAGGGAGGVGVDEGVADEEMED